MNISKLLTGLGAFHTQEKPAQTAQSQKAGQSGDNAASIQDNISTDSISVAAIWRKVAGQVNVRSATPTEIITLSSALFKAGAISYDDYVDLSFQPEINLDSGGETASFSHDRKDYIALWQDKEQKVIRSGGNRGQIEDTHRIQAILKYVDSLK